MRRRPPSQPGPAARPWPLRPAPALLSVNPPRRRPACRRRRRRQGRCGGTAGGLLVAAGGPRRVIRSPPRAQAPRAAPPWAVSLSTRTLVHPSTHAHAHFHARPPVPTHPRQSPADRHSTSPPAARRFGPAPTSRILVHPPPATVQPKPCRPCIQDRAEARIPHTRSPPPLSPTDRLAARFCANMAAPMARAAASDGPGSAGPSGGAVRLNRLNRAGSGQSESVWGPTAGV